MEKLKREPREPFKLNSVYIIVVIKLGVVLIWVSLGLLLINNAWTPNEVPLDLTFKQRISPSEEYILTDGSYSLTFASEYEQNFKITINDEFLETNSLHEERVVREIKGPAVIRELNSFNADMYISSPDGGVMLVDYSGPAGPLLLTIAISLVFSVGSICIASVKV